MISRTTKPDRERNFMNPPDILKTIVSRKKKDLSDQISRLSVAEMGEKARSGEEIPRSFGKKIGKYYANEKPAIIAEIKRASPSKGIIRENFDPGAIAKSYESGGASCISVLTDVYFFQGAPEYIRVVKDFCSLPVLRKDFIIDEYQIFESKVLGADCIMLIAAILDIAELHRFYELALSLDMDVLVEVHNKEELDKALTLSPLLIGINNRNLRTFEVSTDITLRMVELIPEDVLLITESGITTRSDVERMLNFGVYGFLVGEAFMREPDPEKALRNMFQEL